MALLIIVTKFTIIDSYERPGYTSGNSATWKSSQQRCSIKKHCPKGLQLYLKKTPTQVFYREYCEIFKNTFFENYLRTAASKNEKSGKIATC